MSINYRKVDPNAVGADVMKDRALELEQRAYAMETEVDCLVVLLEADPANGTLVKQLEDAKEQVEKLRRAASRGAGAAPLTTQEVTGAQTQFLENWLENLERSHAQMTALANEAKRQKGLKGVDALDAIELVEVDMAAKQLEHDIEVLELRHEFCVGRMASVSNGEQAENNLEEVTVD